MKDYKVFIPFPIVAVSYGYSESRIESIIPSGVYSVIEDTGSYEKNPSQVLIQFAGAEFWLYLSRHTPWDHFPVEGVFPVYQDFDFSFLYMDVSNEEMTENLQALRPASASVEEYVFGDADIWEEWEGFGSIRAAWLSAVMYDRSYYFVTRKRMDHIFTMALGD